MVGTVFMTGQEVIDILEAAKKRYKIGEKEAIIIGKDTLPATWKKISSFVTDFYFYKYIKRAELGYSVPYYDDPKYVKITSINYKKNRKCIYLYLEITYETYTWTSSGRIYLNDFLDEGYKEKISKELTEKKVNKLSKQIDKLMTELGKCCEELEKIEGTA